MSFGGVIMRRVYYALLAAVAVIGFTIAASAADLPVKAPAYKAPSLVAPSWAGWYIGANAGWVGSNNSINNSSAGPIGALLTGGPIPTSVSLNENGFIGGGQVGINWQAGNLVYGMEADFDGASAKASTTIGPITIAPFVPVTTAYSRELDWLATFRGRIGITASQAFLLYATGGLAVGQTKVGNTFICPLCVPAVSTTAQSTNTSAGWTVGAGVEWMFAPHWSLKGEYLYVDLGSHSSTVTWANGPSTLTSTVRDAENIVRGGINYHF